MYPMTLLEWWRDGAWREIGWRAFTPKAAIDLHTHAKRLARGGGAYRLIHPSIFRDGPPTVLWESES